MFLLQIVIIYFLYIYIIFYNLQYMQIMFELFVMGHEAEGNIHE